MLHQPPSIGAYFDQRAPAFDQTPWATDPAILEMFEIALHRNPHIVLDIGGGTGILPRSLCVSRPRSRFLNVDISHEMTVVAQRKSVCSIVGDAGCLPVKSGIAASVLLRQVIHYLPDPRSAIRECKRVTASGGQLLLGQFVPFDDADRDWMRKFIGVWDTFIVDFPTLEELTHILSETGFSIERVGERVLTESVSRWLGRYEGIRSEVTRNIWSLFRIAAENGGTRDVYRRGEDIEFHNRFVLISATLAL